MKKGIVEVERTNSQIISAMKKAQLNGGRAVVHRGIVSLLKVYLHRFRLAFIKGDKTRNGSL
jgi:hypothetical protein